MLDGAWRLAPAVAPSAVRVRALKDPGACAYGADGPEAAGQVTGGHRVAPVGPRSRLTPDSDPPSTCTRRACRRGTKRIVIRVNSFLIQRIARGRTDCRLATQLEVSPLSALFISARSFWRPRDPRDSIIEDGDQIHEIQQQQRHTQRVTESEPAGLQQGASEKRHRRCVRRASGAPARDDRGDGGGDARETDECRVPAGRGVVVVKRER